MAAVDDTTALVHVQWANHEVGTIQPVAEVVAACRDRGVLVHVDAAMAAGHLPIDFVGLGIDLMSISGHKFGAPTGTGALVVRRGLRIPPLLVGGDQERARRAGLENVVGAIGFGAAASEALGSLDAESARSTSLTDRVLAWAGATEGITVFGDPDHRLPHLVCLGFDGVEPQPVLIGLDQAGIAVHSGSSCSTESLEPSPVLEAMGVDAHRSLRVSVGWNTTDADIGNSVGGTARGARPPQRAPNRLAPTGPAPRGRRRGDFPVVPHPYGWESLGSRWRVGPQDSARTVRSRMPSVAFSADSGMIGHTPSGFHSSVTADQS